MTTTKKLKKPAQRWAPQSTDETQSAIKTLGDLQRQHLRITTELNDVIARETELRAPQLENLRERIAELQVGVQSFCESHREQLCGKGKSANLITGEVAWRQRPPSVRITKQDFVIDWLIQSGLHRFVRTKEEVNKEAMLAEPDVANKCPGVSVITGVEDFSITPFEITTDL